MVNEVKTYKHLPEGFIQASSKDDFLNAGRRKVGLRYILWSELEQHFEEYVITEFTKWNNLQPFVDAGKCFVFNS